MKVNSTTRPLPYKIFVIGDCALIRFAENITEQKNEDETIYSYDEFSVKTKNRAMLKISIEQNYAVWLEKAIQEERNILAAEIREKRTAMLLETDHLCLSDRPEPPEEVKVYRQELRDVTEQEAFPYAVLWPELPNDEKKLIAAREENKLTELVAEKKLELEKEPIGETKPVIKI